MILQLAANTREKDREIECEKVRESMGNEGNLGREKWIEGMMEGVVQ